MEPPLAGGSREARDRPCIGSAGGLRLAGDLKWVGQGARTRRAMASEHSSDRPLRRRRHDRRRSTARFAVRPAAGLAHPARRNQPTTLVATRNQRSVHARSRGHRAGRPRSRSRRGSDHWVVHDRAGLPGAGVRHVTRRVIAIVVWTLSIAAAWLFMGGGQVPLCLGQGEALRTCVAAWEAAHPAPPPILDTRLPWPWLALYVLGVTAIVVIVRARERRSKSSDASEER